MHVHVALSLCGWLNNNSNNNNNNDNDNNDNVSNMHEFIYVAHISRAQWLFTVFVIKIKPLLLKITILSYNNKKFQ